MTGLLSRHLLESTVFCLLLGAIACSMRRQSAALRHSLWLISLLKFSVPTVVLTATGAWIAFVLPSTAWMSSVTIRISNLLAGVFAILTAHVNPGSSSFPSVCLLVLWLLGSAALFGRWFSRLRSLRQNMSEAPDSAHVALNRARRRLGFDAPVELRCCDTERDPALLGIIHPLVVIPSGLSERLSEAELEAVLLHELVHARRRDNLFGALVHCLVCVFWFHPLLWFVERRLSAERERACDEMVIDSGTARNIYLSGLLKVCKFQILDELAGVSAASGSDLRTRFDQIQCHRACKRVPVILRVLVATFAFSMAMLPIAGGYCEQCVSVGHVMTNPQRIPVIAAQPSHTSQQSSIKEESE